MQFENRFAGRRAVVTGGASGIGLAVAERLAAEGARVMIWDRDAAATDRFVEADPRIRGGAVVDLADPEAVRSAVDATVERLGGIDVLVCSAAITGPNTVAWEYPVEAWKNVFDINVHGLFYANRACVPHMMRGKYGRIVNIASIAGKEGNPNMIPYSASKAGVIGFTKALAKEVTGYNILVNAVTPGVSEPGSWIRSLPSRSSTWSAAFPWAGRHSPRKSPPSSISWPARKAAL